MIHNRRKLVRYQNHLDIAKPNLDGEQFSSSLPKNGKGYKRACEKCLKL